MMAASKLMPRAAAAAVASANFVAGIVMVMVIMCLFVRFAALFTHRKCGLSIIKRVICAKIFSFL
jgi:hypothetical protein